MTRAGLAALALIGAVGLAHAQTLSADDLAKALFEKTWVLPDVEKMN
jgi:hypothetical protein